ncbi:MAG: hypothetical protein FIB03_10920 [Anaerolineae bacterium]|nr:hypothetical protein [Anaerolineae bacterium]
MSKLTTRVVLSVLISLGIIFAIFTSVQGASSNAVDGKLGTHLVSGAMVNFNHDRFSVAEKAEYQAQIESYYAPSSGRGHGCESELKVHPDD